MPTLPFQVDLTGKVAVVTGGSGVLCSEMAKALAACGAKVAIAARTEEKVARVVHEITEAGGVALALPADVTSLESLRGANQALMRAWGPCDILVNGAGGNHPDGTAGLEELTPEVFAKADGPTSFYDFAAEGVEFVMNTNYLGTVLTTQVFSRGMAERGSGCVINISSMSAFAPLTKVMSYSAAKAAVNNFTAWLAVHLAKVGVRVNAIAPGFFLTTQNHALLKNEDGTDTARGGKIMGQTPMGRYGEPEELIGALLWLASDQASGFVTGIVVPVDGGFNAYSGV